jgi:hypothetical protein
VVVAVHTYSNSTVMAHSNSTAEGDSKQSSKMVPADPCNPEAAKLGGQYAALMCLAVGVSVWLDEWASSQ